MAVVVRVAFTPEHHEFVEAEVVALEALHALQGSDVPCLLAHGHTCEGYAFVVTECVKASSSSWPALCNLVSEASRIHMKGQLQHECKPICCHIIVGSLHRGRKHARHTMPALLAALSDSHVS